MIPDKVERLLQRAQQAIAQRDWEKAKQSYLMALGLRSDLPDVHYGLATVYFQLKEFTSAAHHFREVTRLDPARAGAFVNLGAVLNLLNQHDDAIAALRRSLQLDSQRVEAYYNLGVVYRRKGQPDLAITAYREAIRINPKMADAHLNLGNLFIGKNQHRQAIKHYEEALKIRPGWEKALEGLDHARAALSGGTREPDEVAPGAGSSATVPARAGLERAVDPVGDGTLLTGLHQASIVSEETGRLMQKILLEEVEPALQELSRVLMNSGGSRGELDATLTKFEASLQRMRSAHHTLKTGVIRLQEYSGKIQR